MHNAVGHLPALSFLLFCIFSFSSRPLMAEIIRHWVVSFVIGVFSYNSFWFLYTYLSTLMLLHCDFLGYGLRS
jgi:hypothetical protein